MHFRVRHSERHPSKYDIFMVGINERGMEANFKIQRLWDDGQLQAENKIQRRPSNFDQNTLFYMKGSKTTFLTDFIVEFADLNCKYIFVIADGIGQWLYEPICGREGFQENGRGIGIISIRHKLFREVLIPVTVQMHNNLTSLFLDCGGIISDWMLCHQPRNHHHQLVNISLDSDYCGKEDHKGSNGYRSIVGYTTYVVCWNARLVDFFDAVCGDRTYKKDELHLTHILPNYTYGKILETISIGSSYSYREARIEHVSMEDLGWRAHEDGRVWMMLSPGNHVRA